VAVAASTDDNAVTPVTLEVDVLALLDEAGETDAVIDEIVDEVVDEVADETVVASVSVVVVEAAVLTVTSGNRLTLPAFVIDNVSDDRLVVLEASSSGQIPDVHGSLEQHPRKLPAVQMYHCLLPVQVSESRGKNESMQTRL
jgi:hypothetical protein